LALSHAGSLLSRTCSSKLQQQERNLAVVDAIIRGWPGTNDAQGDILRHFANKRLGFEPRQTAFEGIDRACRI
jgi:hypothetical protein